MKTLFLLIFLFVILMLPCRAQKIIFNKEGQGDQYTNFYIKNRQKGKNLTTRRPVWFRSRLDCSVADSTYTLEMTYNQRDTSKFTLDKDASIFFLTTTGDSIPVPLASRAFIHNGFAILKFNLSRSAIIMLGKNQLRRLFFKSKDQRSVDIELNEKSRGIIKDDINHLLGWFQVKRAYKEGKMNEVEFRKWKVKYLYPDLVNTDF